MGSIPTWAAIFFLVDKPFHLCYNGSTKGELEDMDSYLVSFRFVEFGKECKTSWIGPAKSKEDVIRKASDWFGFKKDNITVLEVTCE